MPRPDAAFEWIRRPAGMALVCRPLVPIALHLFTTRSWLLGGSATPDAWAQVADAVGTDPNRLVRARQVHGAGILVQRAGQRPVSHAAADIIAGNDSSVALAIQTADCVPLLIGDRRTGAVIAAHAGWRGTAVGVAAAAITALANEFGSRPADLCAAVGPSIGPCCYQVGGDVRDRFARQGFADDDLTRWFLARAPHLPTNPPMTRFADQETPGALFLNLWAATRDQLEAAGVPPDQIFVAALCTASHDEAFCSYRRDGQDAGRLAAVIRKRELQPG